MIHRVNSERLTTNSPWGRRLAWLFSIEHRLLAAVAIIIGMMAAFFLRGRLVDYLWSDLWGIAIALVCLLFAWKRTRRGIEQVGDALYQRWQAIGPRGQVISGTLGVLVLVLINTNYLLNLPLVLQTSVYQPQAGGDAVLTQSGQSKDTTIQFTLYGLQQGCLLCGANRPDARPEPIENLVAAEDLGLIFFFGVAVKSGLLAPTVQGYHLFIVALFVGASVLAALVVGLAYRSIGATVLFLVAIFSSRLLTPLPYLTSEILVRSYGVPTLIMFLTAAWGLAILARTDRRLPGARTWVTYLCSLALGLTAGFGFLARSESGYIALMAGAGLLLYWTFAQRKWGQALALWLLLGLGFALPLAAFDGVLAARFAWYALPPVQADKLPGHGIWHNAFIGLGYVPNRWGIVWDDQVGAEFAAKNCPGVGFATYQYFDCLKGQFFKIVRADPGLLVRNLVVKTVMMFVIVLFTPAALWAAIAVGFTRLKNHWITIGYLLMLLLLTMLPGLLAIPERNYAQGFFAVIVCLGVVSLLNLFAVDQGDSNVPAIKEAR